MLGDNDLVTLRSRDVNVDEFTRRILARAVFDYFAAGNIGAVVRKSILRAKRLREDAAAWLFGPPNDAGICAFENICDAIGRSMADIRSLIRRFESMSSSNWIPPEARREAKSILRQLWLNEDEITDVMRNLSRFVPKERGFDGDADEKIKSLDASESSSHRS